MELLIFFWGGGGEVLGGHGLVKCQASVSSTEAGESGHLGLLLEPALQRKIC